MPKKDLTIQEWSVLTLIAETPEAPKPMIDQAVRSLDGEANRVGTAMKKQLKSKKTPKTSGRSAQTALDIFHRTQCSGFVKYDKTS